MNTCNIDGCEGIVKSKGLCGKHYIRKQRYGNPLYIPDRMHGMTGIYEYDLWHYIKKTYPVCDRWLVFKNFHSDIGEKPAYEYWLTRIDDSKPFGPDNFKWRTKKGK